VTAAGRAAGVSPSAVLVAVLVGLAGLACRRAPAPSPPVPTVMSAPRPASPGTPAAPRLAFERSPVEVAGRFGAPSSKDVRLTGELARDAEPTVVAVEGDEVVATSLPRQGAHAAGIRLTLAGKRAGQGVGHVVVSTGLPDPKEVVLYYGWKVPGNLTVSPSNPIFNLRLSGPHLVEIAVGSSRPDFRLRTAEVAAGPFSARVVPAGPPGRYTVQVQVLEAGVANGQRGFLGKLILHSNDPAEPRKEIPLLALGAPHPSSAPSP
jgi:hypothetical protein